MKSSLKSSHVFKLSAILSVALAAVGCGADGSTQAGDEPREEAVGSAEQAFTNGYYTYGWNNIINQDTGLAASEWTCFLSAVYGALESASGEFIETQAGNTGYAGATIGSNGHWYILNQNDWNSTGSAIGSAIMCVPSATHQTAVAHWAGGSAIQLSTLSTTTDPNLTCGLVAIGDTSYYASDNKWEVTGGTGLGSGDSAFVFQDGGYWYLGGSGNAEAWAVCVDHTAGYGNYGWEYSGSGSNNLLTANIDTEQCFMYGVGGSFRDASNYSDGVSVNYTSSDHEWSETTANGKAIGVTCMR